MRLLRRLRDEFTAAPGLQLTEPQVQRLCNADAPACASALRALVSAGFLKAMPDGSYRRSTISTATEMPLAPQTDAPQPAWRGILCLIDVESERGGGLSAASHAALRYATALAVARRARITALHVVRELPQRMAFSAGEIGQVVEEQQQFLATRTAQLRKAVAGGSFPGLLNVRVAVGTPEKELLRMATDARADLIVLGRGGHGGMVSLAQLREVWHHAPCPVLIVHESGHAAVA